MRCGALRCGTHSVGVVESKTKQAQRVWEAGEVGRDTKNRKVPTVANVLAASCKCTVLCVLYCVCVLYI